MNYGFGDRAYRNKIKRKLRAFKTEGNDSSGKTLMDPFPIARMKVPLLIVSFPQKDRMED